jgi:hypothetical protein
MEYYFGVEGKKDHIRIQQFARAREMLARREVINMMEKQLEGDEPMDTLHAEQQSEDSDVEAPKPRTYGRGHVRIVTEEEIHKKEEAKRDEKAAQLARDHEKFIDGEALGWIASQEPGAERSNNKVD